MGGGREGITHRDGDGDGDGEGGGEVHGDDDTMEDDEDENEILEEDDDGPGGDRRRRRRRSNIRFRRTMMMSLICWISSITSVVQVTPQTHPEGVEVLPERRRL